MGTVARFSGGVKEELQRLSDSIKLGVLRELIDDTDYSLLLLFSQMNYVDSIDLSEALRREHGELGGLLDKTLPILAEEAGLNDRTYGRCVELWREREKVVDEIGEYKRIRRLPIHDSRREREHIADLIELCPTEKEARIV